MLPKSQRRSCTIGNLLHSLPYNGNSLTPSTSIRDQRLLPSQTSDSAVGLSSSSSVDTSQELSERVWGLLVEGLQPYMQWELQSGMGDLWDQVFFFPACRDHQHPCSLSSVLLCCNTAEAIAFSCHDCDDCKVP